jgi:carbonic anhydrase
MGSMGSSHFPTNLEPNLATGCTEPPSAPNDDAGTRQLPATGRFALLTCMDGSLDASKFVGLPGSEAQVIRNPGARVTEDAVRSLVLAHDLLGARAWFIVQHSHCGMALLDDELTAQLWPAVAKASNGAGCLTRADRVDRSCAAGVLPVGKIGLSSQEEILAADLARLRAHPLVPARVRIRGFMYRAETGRLIEVASAS